MAFPKLPPKLPRYAEGGKAAKAEAIRRMFAVKKKAR